ncbi:MAG: amino acid racemase [bacterium]|nr:amino acid racemase [bacterium]
MKRIGLVGGTTPESTKVYYEMLIDSARKPGQNPLHNPEILIYSIDLEKLVRLQRQGSADDVAQFLANVCENLRECGAEIGALTANTPHAYLAGIEARTSLPMVSIVQATRHAACDLGVKRALLLGTRTTMESEMYPTEFAAAGIDIVLPNHEDREFIDHAIYHDLAVGTVLPEVRERFLSVCAGCIEQDRVDGVILGCTEIPLVIAPEDVPVQVMDTAKIHVEAILRSAGD